MRAIAEVPVPEHPARILDEAVPFGLLVSRAAMAVRRAMQGRAATEQDRQSLLRLEESLRLSADALRFARQPATRRRPHGRFAPPEMTLRAFDAFSVPDGERPDLADTVEGVADRLRRVAEQPSQVDADLLDLLEAVARRVNADAGSPGDTLWKRP